MAEPTVAEKDLKVKQDALAAAKVANPSDQAAVAAAQEAVNAAQEVVDAA